MSFIFGTSRADTLLLALAASIVGCALGGYAHAGGTKEVCKKYANEAFYTVEAMMQNECAEVDRSGGPGMFSIDYREHFNWCRNESTPQWLASETRARNAAKAACLARPPNVPLQQKKAMCKAYSDQALSDSDEMAELKCEERSGMWNTRYSLASNHHRDWCMNEATPEAMRFEQETRTAAKTACYVRLLKPRVCAKYAAEAVQMSNQYQINRCTTEHHPSGRFSYKYNDHYNWCMHTANHVGGEPKREDAARVSELDSCKKRNAAKSAPKIKMLQLNLPVKQSADTDESSEEPPLQVSNAAQDLFESPYTPIKKLKVKPAVEEYTADIIDVGPAPKQRTEKIVVGNRYVEVPAYSDEYDVDTGRIVKAGAAAVVVGTAAVVTGAVAAKALDYADDYKGGINKSMSGAAEALKEKLKDKLSGGGGINKSMSGAVEAMKDKFSGTGGINKSMSGAAAALKEKLKDRVASGGGITKAMSGAKEALKYKLKERAAGGGLVSKAASGFKEKVKSRLTGGGGGLMKGMAKASGGVLRGLLRR